jgi:23S rRNA pseudouridine2605 synthase
MAKRSQTGGRSSKSGKGRSERNSNPDSRKSSSTGGKPRTERKRTSSRSDSPKSYGAAAGRKPRFSKDDSSDSRKGDFGKRSDSTKSYGAAPGRKPRFSKDDSSDSRKGNFGSRSDSPKSYGSSSERKPRFSKDDSSDSRKGNFGKRSDSSKSYGSASERKPRFSKDDSSDSRKRNFGSRSDSPKSYGSASERKPRFSKGDSSDSRRGNFGKRSDSPKSYGSASERKPRFSKDDSSDSRKRNFSKSSDSPKPYRSGPGSRPRFSKDEPRSDSEKGNSGKRSSSFDPKARFKDDDKKAGSFRGKKFEPREETKPGRFSDDSRQKKDAPAQTEKIRLNRYIANSGVCSRREADELITMGLISVNGKTITELGFKVNPTDEVRYESRLLRAEKPVYILLNKPKGYLTTTNDPQERDTVMHLIGDKVRERIYPVGRLDRNTTGLLLLTNDGDLADKLMHPSYNVKKIYKVELDRPLTKGDFQKIQEGVRLEEGVAQVDDLAIVSEDGKTVGIELHIGWNRVVRRIFESLEYQVVKLDRSVYAGLDKKELSRGQWRYLRQEEVVRLKHFK